MELIRLEKTESTNDYLKNRVRCGMLEPAAVIAKEQTGGRGLGEHTFFSPPGGLYLSYLMIPETSPEETAGITHCAGAIVRRVLAAFYPGAEIKLKPVNDLYLNGHKICGILTELSRGALVIGIGINVNTRTFPEDLPASSLFLETGTEADIDCLARALLTELEILSSSWPRCKNTYEEEYRKNLLG